MLSAKGKLKGPFARTAAGINSAMGVASPPIMAPWGSMAIGSKPRAAMNSIPLLTHARQQVRVYVPAEKALQVDAPSGPKMWSPYTRASTWYNVPAEPGMCTSVKS